MRGLLVLVLLLALPDHGLSGVGQQALSRWQALPDAGTWLNELRERTKFDPAAWEEAVRSRMPAGMTAAGEAFQARVDELRARAERTRLDDFYERPPADVAGLGKAVRGRLDELRAGAEKVQERVTPNLGALGAAMRNKYDELRTQHPFDPSAMGQSVRRGDVSAAAVEAMAELRASLAKLGQRVGLGGHGVSSTDGKAVQVNPKELQRDNDANVLNMCALLDAPGWEEVARTAGERPIVVWNKRLEPGSHCANEAADDEAAAKFAAVKTSAVLAAAPEAVYQLFLDNTRVGEYNEMCQQLEDVQWLDPNTKVAWSVTGRFGPFKPRDFVTVVHFRQGKDGALMAVNRPATHPAKLPGETHQRGELLLAGNVIEPVPGRPDQARLTMITHCNPGGVADNAVGAMVVNKLSKKSPIDFVRKVEAAAQSA